MSNNSVLQLIKQVYGSTDISTINIADFYKRNIPNPIIIPISITNPVHIIRVRKNDIDIFYNIKDLASPPDEKAKLGRANLDSQSMFYGIIPQNNLDEYALISSLTESTPHLFEVDNNKSSVLTISTWKITKQIMLFTMPIPRNEFLEVDPIASCVMKKWSSQRKIFSLGEIDVVEFLGDLMNNEGSQKIYTLTANYVNHILQLNPYLGGVIYPSVQTKGMSMCVAIKPTVIKKNTQCVKSQMILYSKQNLLQAGIKTIATTKSVTNDSLTWEYKDGYSEDIITNIIKGGE